MPARRLAAPGRLLSTVLAVAGMTMLAGFAAAMLDFTPMQGLIFALTLVLAGAVSISVLLRGWDPFDPLFIFAIGWGVMFVIRPWSVVNAGDYDFGPWPPRVYNLEASLVTVEWVALLGALAFVAGYALPIGRRLAGAVRGPSADLHPDSAVTMAIAIGAFGLLAFGLFLYQAGGLEAVRVFIYGRNLQQIEIFRKSTAYGYYAPLLTIPATVILIATGRSLRDPVVFLTGLLFTVALMVVYVPNGNRIFMLPLFGSMLVYAYISRAKRPSLRTLLIVGFLGMGLSTVLLMGRDQGGLSYGDAARRIAADPPEMFRSLTRSDDANMALHLASAIEGANVGKEPEYGRATLRDLAVRGVPRVFWSGKPRPPRERVIEELWPIQYRNGSSNPEYSVMLTLYMDLRWLGVVLGLAVMGVTYRLVYEYFLLHRTNQLAQIAFALFVTMIPMGIRDSMTDTFLKAVFLYTPVLFVALVSHRKSRAVTSRNLANPLSIGLG